MNIGLIAMSGVRAWSPELNAAGLTMPGVMERGSVIASMPSLSLLTLAALTPPGHTQSYHEVRDLSAEGPGALACKGFDLVAISTMSAQVKDAYALASALRARGTRVVIGGLHATALPEEALRHCDAVVAGEGEGVWARVVEDAAAGRLAGVYRAPGPFDLSAAPVPRFDLLDVARYNRIPLQTARGCPHSCEFCAGSILLTPGYAPKPAARVDAELRAVREVWEQPFIELADDNSFASRAQARAVLGVLQSHGVRWFTEVDLSIAEDEALLDAMARAGCRQVLIGLESPIASGLDGLETRRNWKLRQFPRYQAAVRRIQSRGITVNGCFILGLDGHDESVFERVYGFADQAGLWDVQITVLTPFPGTPLYSRLLAEGRILVPGAWEKCTLFDVNFVPRGMSPERLQSGLVGLARGLYDPDAVRRRRESYFANLLPGARGRHRHAHGS